MADKLKGRGTAQQIHARFNAFEREAIDDGWFQEAETAPKTEISFESPKTLISRNQSPDLPFSQSINPYRGCEHGCIYCYARPTHAWLGLSPGLDFETKLTVKNHAADLLKQELAARNYQCSPINLGANTDPYQPVERHFRITRQLLEIFVATQHPCHIITKSSMIERDIDLLQSLAERQLVAVHISLTTLNSELSRILEPRASSPARRLKTIAMLHAAKIPVTVLIAPVIPVLTDHELENIIAAVTAAGASAADYILLRLPLEVSPLFEDWLHTHRPQQAQHILNRITDLRAGKRHDPRFGHRMRGQGIYADLLAQRFQQAIKKAGLNLRETRLRCDLFRPVHEDQPQLSLF